MKLRYLLLLLVLVSGCAFFQGKADDAKTCWNDETCRAEVMEKSKSMGDSAGDLASMSGFPWARNVAKPVVSYGSLVVLLCSAGAALKKKREQENPNVQPKP